MICSLVALDKRLGVRPVGIVETLCQDLAKIFMRAAGDQAKTACGNLQLCTGLEASIEGATHVVGQRRLERVRARRSEEEVGSSDEEEETKGMAAVFNNLNIEAAGTDEEGAEVLAAALNMEIEVIGRNVAEGKEGSDGTLRALGDL